MIYNLNKNQRRNTFKFNIFNLFHAQMYLKIFKQPSPILLGTSCTNDSASEHSVAQPTHRTLTCDESFTYT